MITIAAGMASEGMNVLQQHLLFKVKGVMNK